MSHTIHRIILKQVLQMGIKNIFRNVDFIHTFKQKGGGVTPCNYYKYSSRNRKYFFSYGDVKLKVDFMNGDDLFIMSTFSKYKFKKRIRFRILRKETMDNMNCTKRTLTSVSNNYK